MGRLRSKKFRAPSVAAQSGAAKSKPAATPSPAAPSAVAAAAVAAAFGSGDDAENEPQLDGEEDGDDATGLGALSRGQRKRMKRRDAFMRKMGMVKRVVEEKEKAKKHEKDGAFAEIKELQDSLFLSDKELAAVAAGKISQASNLVGKSSNSNSSSAVKASKPLSGKQRQKIAVRELGQLKAVHTHPQFQNDPFAAIQMHLQNTVVQANQATLEQKKATGTDADKKKKKSKSKGTKASAMDVE